MFPDAYYGEVKKEETDFRDKAEQFDDKDDDVELKETPSGVKEILGFDPLDEVW